MSEDPAKRGAADGAGGTKQGAGAVGQSDADTNRGGVRLAEGVAARELRQAVLARLKPGDEEALRGAPRSWTLAGRAAPEVQLGAGRMILVAGGLGTEIRDFGAAPRPLTRDDTARFCRLADALPQVAAVEPPPAADAASPAVARLRAAADGFAASGKHIVAVAADADEVRALAAMAAAVQASTAGGEGPGETNRAQSASVLTVAVMPGERCLEAALTVAAQKLPCLVAVAPAFMAADDPVAAAVEPLAGALEVAAAVQVAAPPAAVGIAVPPGPRTAADAGALAALVAIVQAVHALGLPVFETALATLSPGPDWLAATENTAVALAAGVAGLDALAGAGIVDGGRSVSLEELAADAEIFSYCSATAAGFAVDEETLALDTIKSVGIAGNYLGQRHTRRHMRDVWRTRLFDRTPYEQWQREGRRQSPELAAELVQATLAAHAPQPLGATVVAELDRIALGKESS